jgi:hypothetical protein
MFRYFYKLAPLVVTVVVLSMPWLGLIALMPDWKGAPLHLPGTGSSSQSSGAATLRP